MSLIVFFWMFTALQTFSLIQSRTVKVFIEDRIITKPAIAMMVVSGIGNFFCLIYPFFFAYYLSTWYWGILLFIGGLTISTILTRFLTIRLGVLGVASLNMFSLLAIPLLVVELIYFTFKYQI